MIELVELNIYGGAAPFAGVKFFGVNLQNTVHIKAIIAGLGNGLTFLRGRGVFAIMEGCLR